MTARIYRPAKQATQSGQATSGNWLLEFESETARQVEPLMGWTSSSDTRTQVRLRFGSKEEAVAYAQRNGIAYTLVEPKEATRRIMAYADNFKTTRMGQWTH
ncbi:MAG: complex subunit conserved region [Hyphomicrobiales bacterium]|nr:complex subunit conserved region [Hyphomicrobiales bacterium]